MEQHQDCSTTHPHQLNPMIMSVADTAYADHRTRKIEDEVNLKVKMYIPDCISENIASVTEDFSQIRIFDNTEFGASLTQHSLDVGQVLSVGGSGHNSFELPSSSVYNTPPREALQQPTDHLDSTAFTASDPQASASQQHSTFGQHSGSVPNDAQSLTPAGVSSTQLPTVIQQQQSNATFVENPQINTMSHQQQLLPSSSNYPEQSTSSTYGQQQQQHADIGRHQAAPQNALSFVPVAPQQQAGPSQQNHRQANSIAEIIANYKQTPIDFNNEDSGFYDFVAPSAHPSTAYYEQAYTQACFQHRSQNFSGQLAHAGQQYSDHHFGYSTTQLATYDCHQSMAPSSSAQYQNVKRESVPATFNSANPKKSDQSTDILSQAMMSSQLTGYLDVKEEEEPPVQLHPQTQHHSQMVDPAAQSWNSYQQQNGQSFPSQSNQQQTLKRNLNPSENIESSAKRARTNSINQKQPQPTTYLVIKPNNSVVQVENFNGQLDVQLQQQSKQQHQQQPTMNVQSARASSSVMTSAINQSGVQSKAEGNGSLRYGTLSLCCIVDGCPKVFITRSMLVTHLRAEHGKGAFWCFGCAETFESKHKLSQHVKFCHDKQTDWRCFKCPNKYATQPDLSWHFLSEHHRGQFKCFTEDCAFTSVTRAQVIVHYDQHQHHHCPFNGCVKEYSTENGLHAHSVLVHDKQKPEHICLNCGKAFKNKSDLTRHERTHREARPYQCKWPDCKYHGAKDRATCLNHIRVMHFGMPINKNQRTAAELAMDPRPYMEVVKELLF